MSSNLIGIRPHCRCASCLSYPIENHSESCECFRCYDKKCTRCDNCITIRHKNKSNICLKFIKWWHFSKGHEKNRLPPK